MNLEDIACKGLTLGLAISLIILTLGFFFAYTVHSSPLTTILFYAGIITLVITPVIVITGLLIVFIKMREKYMALITLTVIIIIIISGLLKR